MTPKIPCFVDSAHTAHVRVDMIILEEEADQVPKLPNDPISASSSTSPPIPLQAGGPARPYSPSPSLPDYETSEAQQQLLQRLRAKGTRSIRMLKAFWLATVVYLTLFVIVVVPLIVLRIRQWPQWPSRGPFDAIPPPGPPAPPRPPQTPIDDGNIPLIVGHLVQCNDWRESVELPTFPGLPPMATALLEFEFPPDDIVIRASTTAEHRKITQFAARLKVGMNSNTSREDVVVRLNVQYSRSDLFKSIKACQTKSEETSGLGIMIPEDIRPSDILGIEIAVLLPQTEPHLYLEDFSTYLPSFEQAFGDLAPHMQFGRLTLDGPSSNVSIKSVRASTISIRTSSADISGTFNVTDSLSLDTVNAPITAGISLINDGKSKRPTYLSLDTGNGPINATISLQNEEKHWWARPKVPDFVARTRTFNAPLDLFIRHTDASPPSRLQLQAHNTQGPVNVTLDAMFSGTFDVETKSADAFVQEIGLSTTGEEDEDESWHLLYDRVTPERVLGWMGWGRRPQGKSG
ncbi:hypothetical protein EWM64_g2664 [Hericium alpestre]|uniref:Uncharacterized protein n=1 Tax=Hericium alpestre TaxID=135208 RepID=A0A4Z0A4V5_9AGAM|nr:hypothetical protein EWM64_g2664 [Hericium alpestre]